MFENLLDTHAGTVSLNSGGSSMKRSNQNQVNNAERCGGHTNNSAQKVALRRRQYSVEKL